MKIEIEVSEKNEGTAYPWWVIIDPEKMLTPKVDYIARMITGPFFSREEAQSHLETKSHHFSKKARVYCHTGHDSWQYRNAFKKARGDQ